MFAAITCPACQHKFSIPEGAMGMRQTCPNCHSPFLAGKSAAEAAPPINMGFQPAAATPINKTMLGETEPPIKYNCPRCKKELEAPAIEAGTKKPCPACGQRLQVPAAAPTGAPQAGLNKTILASDESKAEPIRYNCPNCKKPLESPPIEALSKKNCPACGQRFQIPAASTGAAPRPNLNKTVLASAEGRAQPFSAAAAAPAAAATTVPSSQAAPAGSPLVSRRALAIAGIVGGGLVILVLLACLLTGPANSADREKMAKAQKEYEDLKKDIEQKKLLLAQQTKLQEDHEAEWRKITRRQEEERQEFENRRRLIQNNATLNEKQKLDAEEKEALRQQKWEAEKLERQQKHEQLLAKMKADSDALQAQIRAQPVAPIYPPWYSRGYWSGGHWYPY